MTTLASTIMVALLMLAPLGVILYVALVIAIPACRLLDWLAGEEPDKASA